MPCYLIPVKAIVATSSNASNTITTENVIKEQVTSPNAPQQPVVPHANSVNQLVSMNTTKLTKRPLYSGRKKQRLSNSCFSIAFCRHVERLRMEADGINLPPNVQAAWQDPGSQRIALSHSNTFNVAIIKEKQEPCTIFTDQARGIVAHL